MQPNDSCTIKTVNRVLYSNALWNPIILFLYKDFMALRTVSKEISAY